MAPVMFCSLAILDPRVGHTMDILSPLISILCHSLPQRYLSTTWCCLSMPCVVFLACVHVALFLALFLSQGNSLVSSWCDHSMLASSLWKCLTVLSLLSVELSQPYVTTGHTSAFISLIFIEIGMLWLFHIFAVMPQLPALYLTWYGILWYTHHLL